MRIQQLGNDFFGDTLGTRVVGGLLLAEKTFSPGVELPVHSHKIPGFCFVLRGQFRENSAAKARYCGPGDLVFHPAEELHAEHFGGAGGRILAIGMNPDWLRLVGGDSSVPTESIHFANGCPNQLATRLYSEFCQTDDASQLASEGLALELLAEILRQTFPSNGGTVRWLEEVRELLHARFTATLSLAEISRIVGVHPVHLARSFRKRYGRTVGEYVRQLRIEWACRELRTTETPIVDIALRAGFSSQSHFSTRFKILTGFTPSKYRGLRRSR
jgi:AraC family transcriptional regulator